MERLTLDHVARYPRPGTAIPGGLAFSPDGRTLTYLHSQEGSLRRVLWAVDVASGERRVLFAPGEGVTDENVSREEQLRRERQRLLHTGVTHYEWAEHADVVLVPLVGELWLVSPSGEARRVGGDALDPHLAPDGTRIAFVRDGELWVLDVSSGEERRLTEGAEDGLTHGQAEYVAQEELGRSRGFWWSPDGELIAYQETDERHVPVLTIPHWGTPRPEFEQHRYPFAGAENARVRLGVVPAAGGPTRWLDLGDAEYLARVAWHPDGRLFVQTLSRGQRRLELRAYDARTGASEVLLTETSDIWVNLHDDLRFVEPTGEFVWASERSGLKQLYLYGPDGALRAQITDEPWPVDSVRGIDREGRRIAYDAAPVPVEQHLFVAPLDGGTPVRLSGEGGFTTAVFARDLDARAQIRHSLAQAPAIELHTASAVYVLHEPPELELDLPVPELFTFTSRDGETLHGMVYTPEVLPAPLVVRVYGGPHAQTVGDSWGNRVDLRAQYLAREGFLVLSVDNRGSARRGLLFEAALLGRMGTIEVDDQVDGVRALRARGWVDGDAVGIYGWSYGGYMSIMSLLKAPDVFRVGVAGAPVTEWEGYDTAYTERYMGLPEQNPDGYREASALTHASSLEGSLLIVHGMIDENVHFRHTARLLTAFSEANKQVDLLLYPEERHMPRSERDRRSMEDRIVTYLREHLAPLRAARG